MGQGRGSRQRLHAGTADVAAAVLRLLSALYLLVSAWRFGSEAALLHLIVWLALLADALVIGAASDPIARFGARVAWLLPFAVLVTVLR